MKVLQLEYVPLNEKDMQLLHLEEQIQLKKTLLHKKQQRIKTISKQNEFLEEIKNDYDKYYNYIYEQKEQQIKALHLLEIYINDLTMSGHLTTQNIEDAKQEQQKIVGEIKKIKHNLDLMIKNTHK